MATDFLVGVQESAIPAVNVIIKLAEALPIRISTIKVAVPY